MVIAELPSIITSRKRGNTTLHYLADIRATFTKIEAIASPVQLHRHDQHLYRRLSGRFQRHPLSSVGKLSVDENNSRRQSSEEVSSPRKRHDKFVPRPRFRIYSAPPLCPRVITFRGSLTPDNYSGGRR